MTLNDADRNRWQRRLRVLWTRLAAPAAGAGPRQPGPKAVRVGAVLAALLIVTGVTASLGPRPRPAETALSGVPVPASQVEAIKQAARSCPTLNGPRLAAQLMAASGFAVDARSADGRAGVAGLTDELWQHWIPWSDAPRMDPVANITALAHHMCDLVGELRLAGLGEDRWSVALAAHRVGSSEVREAKGVPPTAKSYVDTVSGYAVWYGRQPEFRTDARPSPTREAPAVPTEPRPVPDEHVGNDSKDAQLGAPRPSGRPSSPATTPPGHGPTTALTPHATTAAPSSAGFMISGYQGRCVTVPGGTAQDGVQLQMQDCAGKAGQRWAPGPGGSLRSLGMCMDLAWASSEDGTKVQLARCNGGWAQRFALNAAHDLVNTATGKCVDVRDWNPANGAVLQLWQCSGAENQRWFKR
jgi:hypothetical protein